MIERLLPRHSAHLGFIFKRVKDTPAISNEVMNAPMYALVTLNFISLATRE